MQTTTSSSKTFNNQKDACRGSRTKKMNNNEERNSRIMANIQDTLNSRTPNNLNTQATKKRVKKPNNFSFNSISEAMKRINLADSDTSVSLADVSKLDFFWFIVLALLPINKPTFLNKFF